MPTDAKITPTDALSGKVLRGLADNRKDRGHFNLDSDSPATQWAKRLKKSTCADAISLAECLETCSRFRPCESGGCPNCMSRIQAWFAKNACALLMAKEGTFHRLTLIPPQKHRGLELRTWQRFFRRELRRAGITFGFGGVDVSWNEDRRDVSERKKFEPHWSVHLWLVGLSEEIQTAEIRWKQQRRFPRSEETPRPIKTKPFTDVCEANLLYALKPNFDQRDSTTKPPKRGRKAHRGTRKSPLRVEQCIELALALNRAGIMTRVLMFGAQIHHGSNGPKIRLRHRAPQPSESAIRKRC